MASSTILSRKIIKPSSPIPSSLRHHNLSFRDYTASPAYSPIAFFYSKPENYDIVQISRILENSLSKVLSFYYPFGGRINDNNHTCVDCNDIGAEYFNVRISCPMSEVLTNPYNDASDIVFPQDLPWSNSLSKERISLLVVQLSHFDCGGVAVSVCLSHKIADGYSLCMFLSDWISIARDPEMDFKPSPRFDGVSFFPLIDNPPVVPHVVPKTEQHVSRIYNFSSSSLARLKADIIAANPGAVQNPTRIEVATALIHKCGVAMSMTNSGAFRPTQLCHVMNLRPPIPLNTMGNATCLFSTTAMTEDDVELSNYVARLQKAKQQVRDELKDMTTTQLASYALKKIKEGVDIIKRDIFDVYFCSSMSNLGLYTFGFGWGSPIRVTTPTNPMKNHFFFMDEPSGDGINVLITLTQDDMSIFQNNKELLEFASPVGGQSTKEDANGPF